MQQEDPRAAVHPDLVLLMQPQRRAICCLVLRSGDVVDVMRPLDPFHVYVQDDFTALLFDGTDDAQEGEGFALRAQALLAAHGLVAGLSGPFALAASARGCMLKAQLALDTGLCVSPGRALYPMDELGEAALVCVSHGVLRAQGFECEDFCDAVLEEIDRVDEAEGAQYASSLHAYLAGGLNLRLAAKTMGVHRNTLAYRMQRIQERFALDLSDVNTCFELLFSFWLRAQFPTGGMPPAVAPFDAAAAQRALWRHVERQGEGTDADAPAYGVSLLCVGVRALADEKRAELLLTLRALCAQAACAYDEDALIFALPPQHMERFLSDCQAPCRRAGCPILVTQAFSSARLGRRLALCRYALCAVCVPVTWMQDIGSTLFFMALERKISLAPYLCEDVVRVMDEDATRMTQLSRSLYVYLLNFRDMKKAAQQLGIHRNTLEYQVRKIDALIGRSAQEKRRFMMMCTYKMLALPDMGIIDL